MLHEMKPHGTHNLSFVELVKLVHVHALVPRCIDKPWGDSRTELRPLSIALNVNWAALLGLDLLNNVHGSESNWHGGISSWCCACNSKKSTPILWNHSCAALPPLWRPQEVKSTQCILLWWISVTNLENRHVLRVIWQLNVQVDAWKRHLRIKYFGHGSYCGHQHNSNGAKLRLLTVYVDDTNWGTTLIARTGVGDSFMMSRHGIVTLEQRNRIPSFPFLFSIVFECHITHFIIEGEHSLKNFLKYPWVYWVECSTNLW